MNCILDLTAKLGHFNCESLVQSDVSQLGALVFNAFHRREPRVQRETRCNSFNHN